MNILVISQQYWPETWRITDTCEELVARGHTVTLICGLPNDSRGHVLPEYHKKENLEQVHNGVHIFRIKDCGRYHGDLCLYLKYVSFVRGCRRLLRKLPGKFDVVFVNQLSPVLQAIPAIEYSKKHNLSVLMYCQDLWPESLSARGITNHGFTKPIYDHYLKVSRTIYQSMFRILVTSPLYVDYLVKTCLVRPDKIGLLMQFAEPLFFKKSSVDLHGSRVHNFVFAGNVGKAQDVETLIKASALLVKDKRIAIHIVGDGSDLTEVKRLVKKLCLDNVVFHGRVPLSEMPTVYAGADALVITLSPVFFTSLVVPAKLTAYMAAGKPIIGACNGSTSELIKRSRCGECVASGDYRGLAALIQSFSNMSKEELLTYSNHGREYAKGNFDRRNYFDALEKELILVAKKINQ
jgi:Glycosyltransferase